MVTDSIEDTVSPKGWQKLLDEEGQQDRTDGGQVEVVDHEQAIELQGREVLHDLTATEDDYVVGDQSSGSLLKGGHGGDALDKFELRRGVPDDGGEGLVEDGP